jgi:hypothetical protein
VDVHPRRPRPPARQDRGSRAPTRAGRTTTELPDASTSLRRATSIRPTRSNRSRTGRLTTSSRTGSRSQNDGPRRRRGRTGRAHTPGNERVPPALTV